MSATLLQRGATSVPAFKADADALSWKQGVSFVAIAVVAFHAAFWVPELNGLILVYAYALIVLARASTARLSFHCGFVTGLLTFSAQLYWFWHIFGAASVCLWMIISFFTGVFVWGIRRWRTTGGEATMFVIVPILWTALEYFRSEVYFLRFSWLTAGSAFAERMGAIPFEWVGTYGVGSLVFAFAAAIYQFGGRWTVPALSVACLIIAGMVHWPMKANEPGSGTRVSVAGIQLEFPPELTIPDHLDRVLERYPAAELLVLSEYTLESGVPRRIREWCRDKQRYLIVGGKDETEGGSFYNTAFVVGPSGEIVFKQAKSMPIQFFKDGLAAEKQETWKSPWGRIAICVCYDLSYRRPMDRFVKDGAQAFVVPFMDLTDWGAYQHELHTRVAPVRAREYGVPIFRLGSSGISQNVDARGVVLAKASFPGPEAIFGGEMWIGAPGRKPLDAWLGPGCLAMAPILFGFGLLRQRTSNQSAVRAGGTEPNLL